MRRKRQIRKRRTKRFVPRTKREAQVFEKVLAAISLSRREGLLEAHHVFGRKRDWELTVVLCRNCHAEITEDLMRAGIPMVRERDSRRRTAYALLSAAVFFKKYVESLEKLAQNLMGDRK